MKQWNPKFDTIKITPTKGNPLVCAVEEAWVISKYIEAIDKGYDFSKGVDGDYEKAIHLLERLANSRSRHELIKLIITIERTPIEKRGLDKYGC